MKSKDIINIIKIVELAGTYGTPLVIKLIDTWDNDKEITPAMIEKLKIDIKPAADLFPELNT